MATISEAKQMVAVAKAKAQQTREQLAKSRQALPERETQKALRSKLAGLKGREMRRKIKGAEEEIGTAISKVKQYEEEVIPTYEAEIKIAEEQRAAQEEQIRTNYLINRLIQGKPLPLGTSDEEARAVNIAIEKDPEILKAIERASTYQLTETGMPITEQQVEKLSRMGFKFTETEAIQDLSKIDDRAYAEQIESTLPTIKQGVEMFGLVSAAPSVVSFGVGTGKISKAPSWVGGAIDYSKSLIGRAGDFILGTPTITKETYVPTLGGFISASPTGAGATGIIRMPTIEERKEIEGLGKTASFIFGGDTKAGNLLTANIGDLQKSYAQVEQVNKDLSRITKELSNLEKSGDTEAYNKKYAEYEQTVNRFKSYGGSLVNETFVQPTIRTGAFGYFVNRDVSELKFIKDIEKKPLTLITKGAGLTAGGFLGGVLREKLPEEGVYTMPSYNATTYTPQFGSVSYDVLTGEPVSGIGMTTIPSQNILTSAQGEFIGKTAGDISPYFIPIVGESLFYGTNLERLGQNIGEQGGLVKGGVAWFKESPIESAVAVGIPLFRLGSAGYSFLTKPLIRVEKLTPAGSEPFGIIGKPTKVVSQGGKTITYYDDILGYSRVAKEGSKTTITSRWNELFGGKVKVTKGGVEFLGAEPLYAGIPYGEGVSSYQTALELLIKKGYTKSQAQNILRLRKPELIENLFKGKAIITEAPTGTTIDLRGLETAKKLKGEVGGVKFGGGLGNLKFIESSGIPVGTTKTGVELFKFAQSTKTSFLDEGVSFSKLSQAGKTRTISNIYTGVKETGQTNLPAGIGEGFVIGKPYTKYQEADIFRQVIPLKRGYQPSTARIFVEEGQPSLIMNLDEMMGVSKNIGFKGGGKSSGKFYQTLSKTDEALATGVLNVVNKPTFSSVIDLSLVPTSQKVFPSISGYAVSTSAYAGQGTYEKTSGGMFPLVGARSDLNTLQLETPSTRIDTGGLIKTKVVSDLSFKTSGMERAREKTPQKEELKEVYQFKEMLKLKQTQETRQAQSLIQKQRTEQKIKPKVPYVPKPIVPVPVKFGLGKAIKRAKEIIGEEGFEAFVTKGGKDISIGKAGTQQEAESLLKGKLIGTLRAGGFLTRGGAKLKATELKTFGGGEFRLSKVSPYKVIEKKGKRLRRGLTGKQIQAFRPKGSKKSSLLGF